MVKAPRADHKKALQGLPVKEHVYVLEHDQYHASQEMFFLFVISWIVLLLGGEGEWGGVKLGHW